MNIDIYMYSETAPKTGSSNIYSYKFPLKIMGSLSPNATSLGNKDICTWMDVI